MTPHDVELQPRKRTEDAKEWIEEGGFASSEALARLIAPAAPAAKKRR